MEVIVVMEVKPLIGGGWFGSLCRCTRAVHPAIYAALVIACALATFVVKRGADGIFACPADGYGDDHYLAYCQAEGYGEYEHGAFWFGLEPSLKDFVSHADVIILGNSRMQHAFSTAATDGWFRAAGVRYYLLGFAFDENDIFEGRLLHMLSAHPRVYIVNLDGFFDTPESQLSQSMAQIDTEYRYEVKRFWQYAQESICGLWPALCGDRSVIFRSRRTGAWHVEGLAKVIGRPVSYRETPEANAVSVSVAEARKFVGDLPVKKSCVLMTIVSTTGTNYATAQAIAGELGLEFIAPRLEDLTTFDGSHLDEESAEKWSKAFFEEAAPHIRKCIAAPADTALGR